MKENFDNAVQYVLNDEGGYAERSNEPGGAVNKGISFQLFEEVFKSDEYFRETFYPGVTNPDFSHLKALSDEAAKYIYHKYVFSKISFDDMPVGVDYVMVNTATMQGVTGATKLLQTAFDLPVTGKLDEATWNVINTTPALELASGILLYQCQAKMNDKRVGPYIDENGDKQKGFGRGWSIRLVRVWQRARKMINNT
jgi:lysozyme family protein